MDVFSSYTNMFYFFYHDKLILFQVRKFELDP
jgi:hypothetical protein